MKCDVNKNHQKGPPNNCKATIQRKIQYDPLMMSQKEAPRKHPWVLSRKVAKMV